MGKPASVERPTRIVVPPYTAAEFFKLADGYCVLLVRY